jgi:hypothetical protein
MILGSDDTSIVVGCQILLELRTPPRVFLSEAAAPTVLLSGVPSKPLNLQPKLLIDLELRRLLALFIYWVPPASPLALKLNIGAFEAILT